MDNKMLAPSLQQQLDANASVNLHHDLIQNMVSLSRESQQEQNAIVAANFDQVWTICKQLEKQIEERSNMVSRQIEDTRDLMRKEHMQLSAGIREGDEKQAEALVSLFDKLKDQLQILEKQTKDEICAAKTNCITHAIDLNKELTDRTEKQVSDLQLHVGKVQKDFEEAARVKAVEALVQKILLELRDVNGRIAQVEQTHKDFAMKTNSNVSNIQDQISQQINKAIEELTQKQMMHENQLLQFQKKHDYQLQTMEGNWKAAVDSLHKDIEKSRDELGARIHTNAIAHDKAISNLSKDTDMRIIKSIEEMKSQESRTKETFVTMGNELSTTKATLLHKISQEENTREHLLAQIRDAIDFTNKNIDHRASEIFAKLENETRTRTNETSQIQLHVSDITGKVEDHTQELAAFKLQVMQDYVTEGKYSETFNDLSNQINSEGARRVQEVEKIDLQMHSLNDALHKSQELFQEKFQDIEKHVNTVKNELVSRDDDLFGNLSVDRLALQKMETTLAHVEADFNKRLEKVRLDMHGQKESIDKSTELHVLELRDRIAGCYDFFNNLHQQTEDEANEKLRRITEDVRRLQGGLSSEANVRMLDVENVFGRLQMLKEEIGAQVESEKRQRVLNEEKLSTDQSQLRRLLNTERQTSAMNTTLAGAAALTTSAIGNGERISTNLNATRVEFGGNLPGSNRNSPRNYSRGIFDNTGSTFPGADTTLGTNSSFLASSPGRFTPSKYLK